MGGSLKRGLILAASVAAVAPTPARAATITVAPGGDVLADDGRCSLREAITAANTDTASGAAAGECPAGAGADELVLPAGRFLLTLGGAADNVNAGGDLDLTSTLTLRGAGADATIIDATGHDRVLDVLFGASATIRDLTVTGGRAPDGGGGSAGLDGGGGDPGADGGGIRNLGTLALERVTVTGNIAGQGGTGGVGSGGANSNGGLGGPGGSGGGIETAGPLTVTGSRIVGNQAGAGGGGGRGQGREGDDTTHSAGGVGYGGDGGAGGRGGGIAVFAAGALTLTGSVISGNTAGRGGSGGSGVAGTGGDSIGSPANAGNGANAFGGKGGSGGDGGGLLTAASATIVTSVVSQNAAGAGGSGARASGGDGGAAAGGTGGPGNGLSGTGGRGGSGGEGGAIAATGGLSVEASTLAGNTAGSGGTGGPADAGAAGSGLGAHDGQALGGDGGSGGNAGGVLASGGGALANSTLDGNATGAGGAGGTPDGAEGTAHVGGDGGHAGSIAGLWNQALGFTITHATISSNLVGARGAAGGGATPGSPGSDGVFGALGRTGGTLTVADSIMAYNSSNGCNTLTDGGGNLRFPDETCPGTTADPRLDPLADNGGPEPTRRPGAFSPAIDLVPASGAGCLPTDQRGLPRPFGTACDAGAYEVTPPAATTGEATAITTSSATLAATVNPNGPAAQVSFDYGTTAAYGSTAGLQSLAAGVVPAAVTAALIALPQGTLIHYRVVVTTADGTTYGADRTFGTAIAAVVGGASDTTAPLLSALKLDPSRFAVSSASTALTAKARKKAKVHRGSHVKFKLSEAARTVTLTIERKSTHKRKKTHKKVTTYKKVGTLTRTGKSGSNSIAFSGRLGRKALSAGSYRVRAVATDAAGNASKAKTATFTIVHSR